MSLKWNLRVQHTKIMWNVINNGTNRVQIKPEQLSIRCIPKCWYVLITGCDHIILIVQNVT